MSWTIKGEAGAALDETERTLNALNIDSAKLTLASLDADTFEWSAATTDAAGNGTIIPDAGQLIEVFYNGIRRFRGHVSIPRIQTRRVSVTVEGPWWWWQRIPLTQDQDDDESNTAERPSYVFPTQSLKISLEALIDRAIANGVPVIRGSVATMFDFPRITLTERTCAQALADLMSICPDAVAYYDYSGASGTNPILNIIRRGGMTETTLTHGTDPIEELDIYPRLDLEVSRVKIGSVTRNPTTGANQWATQTAGTATPGKNQIIVVSGPEAANFLPKDRFDQFDVQTFAMPTGGIALGVAIGGGHTVTSVTGPPKDFVLSNDETIATMIREFGSSFGNYLYLSNGGTFGVSAYVTGNMSYATYFRMDKPNLIAKDDPAGLYVVASKDRIPEWAEWENGYTVRDATMTGFVRYTRNNQGTPPSWWDEASRRAAGVLVGYPANSGGSAGDYQRNLFFEFAIPVQLISTHFASLTTIYRQWDFDYVQPPATLASDLLAAQNWIPHEGMIRCAHDTVDGAQDLHRKWHVAGGVAAHASMGALGKRIVYDLVRRRKTINLGAPARTDFGTLASKFRRSPKDNIVYL